MPTVAPAIHHSVLRLLAVVALAAAGAALMLGLLGQRSALGAPGGGPYAVNSTLDLPDGDPNDNVCNSFPGNLCTLRAAIMQANHDAAPVTITIPAGTYVLTRTGVDDSALAGDLDIAGDLSLLGAGAGLTIVDGNSALTGERVFHVLATPNSVQLSGMTIRGGSALMTTSLHAGFGGGVFADAAPANPLKLRRLSGVVIENNKARQGGGFLALSSRIEIDNSIIQGNSAVGGGGIYATNGQLLLTNSTLRANTASDRGGGLHGTGIRELVSDSRVYSNSALFGGGMTLDNSSDLQLERVEIYSNTADTGGGMYVINAGGNSIQHVSVKDSYLHDNHAATAGGAIYQFGYPALDLVRTTVDENVAGVFGGGMDADISGKFPSLIIDSTLSRNRAQYGGAIYRGLQAADNLTLVIQNSTLSGNSVTHQGGGLYIVGGGILAANTTIAANRVQYPFMHSYLAIGGGVFLSSTAVFSLQNSLLADNLHTDGVFSSAADDCYANPPTYVHSLGFNLVETITNCLTIGTITGNIAGQDPLLGPLQDNGGPTQTQAPKAGSPAIEAGNSAGCKDYANQPLATDQRGFARPGSVRCDIGAIEFYLPGVFLPLLRR